MLDIGNIVNGRNVIIRNNAVVWTYLTSELQFKPSREFHIQFSQKFR